MTDERRDVDPGKPGPGGAGLADRAEGYRRYSSPRLRRLGILVDVTRGPGAAGQDVDFTGTDPF